ncbi:NADH oxidase [Brevundimonas sp. GW460-12-10-14-LB2]|jgi:NADPH2:quinone reductase|uniref:zinc-binding dehydrogenase n=2 Tax=Caulobacteraceae TaxID=76892 RepID=UPI0007BC8972|nr:MULTISPECIES: zinc-binding dehydrogenase [Brevundimonas]ANC53191.1 NADH oxidase [Brevundimonas sp. GW460-12-10-14-LB2]MEA3474363.1 zinc-binding dehydrogenase [Pseudomonadota bacterium]NSX31995.1 zinc-binding dehydrogenase [Brevundimonas vesicularis]
MAHKTRELRSTVNKDGVLTLSLAEIVLDDPASDEIIVRIEAAPINPSDLGLLLGPADATSVRKDASDGIPQLRLDIPPARMGGMAGRINQSLPVGNEGAGTVIAAGDQAKDWIGRRVGVIGGGMYADLRKIRTRDALPLPEGVTAAQGAALTVNPMTALGFVETARAEGHSAIVHTAAASSLGQMLQRICAQDGVQLVNIVRSDDQLRLLKDAGATHVLNSREDDFRTQLIDAVTKTGATIAFDAIGGGSLGGDIMRAMERGAVNRMTEYSRYGSSTFKQLYVYGALDTLPMVLDRLAFGFQWSVSGWLLTPFMQKAGPETVSRMRKRVFDELTTTFATRYTRTIGLAEALEPEILRAYERKATGEKFLIDPTLN